MTVYPFSSRVKTVGQFNANWSQDVIKNEPMFFNCSVAFAKAKGGLLTHAFLSALPKDWKNAKDIIIDSRVHMLMPGWCPCIPGWHHDDVARDGSGQPNYDKQPYKSKHLLGLVNSEVAPTQFAIGDHVLPKVAKGKTVYKYWHNIVEDQIKDGTLRRQEAKSGRIYAFDWQTMHAGQKAVGSGWRWFIRLTIRQHNYTNEIRNQVNVYLENPTAGW